jgi:hypothetical protein
MAEEEEGGKIRKGGRGGEKQDSSQVWWYTPVIAGRLRQENCMFLQFGRKEEEEGRTRRKETKEGEEGGEIAFFQGTGQSR